MPVMWAMGALGWMAGAITRINISKHKKIYLDRSCYIVAY